MRDESSTQRSRRAVLGLTAGALAGVAGCTSLGDTGDPPPDAPTSTPTETPTPTPTGTAPDGSPTPVDPAALTVTDVSVQSSLLGRHRMGGYLSLRTSDGWLVAVTLGTSTSDEQHDGRWTPGYPERRALRLRLEGPREASYEASRRWGYEPIGDAAGAWTVFAVPPGSRPRRATVEWPAENETLGTLPAAALDRLGRDPPVFTLESFVAGAPGTTPAPTPHGSPTPASGDPPTTTVDYELTVRNDGGAGTFRGLLDHETPMERVTADYSQGGTSIVTPFDAGERQTLTGRYTVYHREDDRTVRVRAETAGGHAVSHVATGD